MRCKYPSSRTYQTKRLNNRLNMIPVPNVKKIVYSTCSIHATENEHVVRDALRSAECQIGGFVLASRDEVLPQWHRRGYVSELDDEGAMLRDLLTDNAHFRQHMRSPSSVVHLVKMRPMASLSLALFGKVDPRRQSGRLMRSPKSKATTQLFQRRRRRRRRNKRPFQANRHSTIANWLSDTR